MLIPFASIYYHHKEKGCDLQFNLHELTQHTPTKDYILIYDYCHTHEAKVCRCGRQFKHHFI